ncbi:MAG: pteridine reductase [Gammaproteobacteria bacterium]|nr:pteridine reductase [Gammaproteobacteria bacterium]
MSLSEKSALVTGAANRLGAQIARTLHQNGANLIIHYRDSVAAAQALAQELNQTRAGSALSVAADLAADSDIDRLAEQACSAFGGLHLLVNNASSCYPTRFGEIDRQAWDDLIASNYRAPLFLAQACHTALKQSRGCIINMIDIYASRPLAGHSIYCSAKAANQMLVKSLALELAPEVRVNGIAPGAMLWPEKANHDSAQRQAQLDEIPLKRLGGPQVIADTVLFLANNDYITGEIVRVDGGRLLC